MAARVIPTIPVTRRVTTFRRTADTEINKVPYRLHHYNNGNKTAYVKKNSIAFSFVHVIF